VARRAAPLSGRRVLYKSIDHAGSVVDTLPCNFEPWHPLKAPVPGRGRRRRKSHPMLSTLHSRRVLCLALALSVSLSPLLHSLPTHTQAHAARTELARGTLEGQASAARHCTLLVPHAQCSMQAVEGAGKRGRWFGHGVLHRAPLAEFCPAPALQATARRVAERRSQHWPCSRR
jgi:hypothetical protein